MPDAKPKPAPALDPGTAPVPYHLLVPDDAVVPAVLHCTQRIPVTGAAPALPPPTPPTGAQCYAASERATLPAWMQRFPGYVVAEISALMRDLGPIGAPTGFEFDPYHRLDDRTFLGKPSGKRVPVLGVRLSDADLEERSGATAAKRFRRFQADDLAETDSFSVEVRDLASFGPPWSEEAHVPTLLVEERYRLVSLETGTSVGALAGTITLLPGERRTIKLTSTSERKTTTKSSRSVVEDASEETTDDFTAEFARSGKTTRKSASSVSWTAAPPGKDLPSPHARTQAWSVDEVVDTTEKTVRTSTQARKATSKVTVSRDTDRVETDKVEGSRTLEIFNPSSQCLTIAYHHLNTAYRTHFDLVEVRLVYTGADAGAEPAVLDLGDLAGSLRDVVGADGAAEAVQAAVVALLEDRYGALGLGKVVAKRYVFETAPDDDSNDRLDSRAALLGPRRTRGPLPLCLSTRTHVVQRDTLHAVPHLSEYAIPEALIAKPKAAADAPATPAPTS